MPGASDPFPSQRTAKYSELGSRICSLCDLRPAFVTVNRWVYTLPTSKPPKCMTCGLIAKSPTLPVRA